MAFTLLSLLFISVAFAQLKVAPATCPARNGAGTSQYDFTMMSPVIYFGGTGNPNTHMSHAEDAGGNIKLDLRLHQNGIAAVPLGPPYNGVYGSPTSFHWNYDYSIDISGLSLTFDAATTAGYRFVIGVDTDPTDAVSLFCYDPINPPGGAVTYFDHCFGTLNQADNTCAIDPEPSNMLNYDTGLTTYSILQQSWRYGFTGAGMDSDVEGVGRYEVYLTALLNNVPVARAEASVIIGTSSGMFPSPATIADPYASGTE